MVKREGLETLQVSLAPESSLVSPCAAIPRFAARSPTGHRRQRAQRSKKRRGLRGQASKLTPASWWQLSESVSSHHSKPFQQLREIFDFGTANTTDHMPQKWKCQCGQMVPMTMAFCGQCGKRWTKSQKAQTHTKGKPKSTKEDEGTPSNHFAFPDLGFVLSSVSSSSSQTHAVGSTDQANAATKSVKALLHQRANRIGKVEARISRLESAVKEVEKNWPAYVHQISQLLASEHQKCIQFHAQANAELTQLRTEMKNLLMQDLCPDGGQATNTGLNTLSYLHTMANPMSSQMPSLHIPSVVKPMDVDMNHGAASMQFPIPSVHPQVTAFEVPQLPIVEPETAVHHHKLSPAPESPPPVQEIPPGNWTWPPAAPQPDLQTFQLPTVPPEAQPIAVSPQVNAQAVSQQLEPHIPAVPEDPVLPVQAFDIAPEVQHAINQASQAMLAYQRAVTGDTHATLTQEQMAQLHVFGQQQLQNHAQLQQFQAAVKHTMPVPSPCREHVPAAPASPGAPAPKQDTLSVASSPAKSTQQVPTSPLNPRQLKIPKCQEGNVHQQPVIGPFQRGTEAQFVALNDTSPVPSPRTPTPVPTEVATPSEKGGPEPGALQQLE